MIEIQLLSDRSLLPDIFRLRTEVWREANYYLDAYFEQDAFIDSHDEHAMHWAALENGSVLASARLCLHDCFSQLPDLHRFPLHFGRERAAEAPVASLNRLVVHKTVQGQGLARRLDHARVEAARCLGAKSAVVVPVEMRTTHLRAMGFEAVAAAVPSQYALQPVNEHCMLLRFPDTTVGSFDSRVTAAARRPSRPWDLRHP